MRRAFRLTLAALALTASASITSSAGQTPPATPAAPQAPAASSAAAPSPSIARNSRCFEMRTYYTHPGKLEALNARFRDHTTRLFEKHGMTNVGYWVPKDKPETLVYILAHASREAAAQSWKAFIADPAWVTVRNASEANGPIIVKIESVFLDATDYSPIK